MKKSTLLGILLNVCFILSIFTIRYYYAKQEMDFLLDDSERQEKLISANEVAIDSLSTVTRRLQIDNDTQEAKLNTFSKDLYDIVRWSKEYEQRIQNLITELQPRTEGDNEFTNDGPKFMSHHHYIEINNREQNNEG